MQDYRPEIYKRYYLPTEKQIAFIQSLSNDALQQERITANDQCYWVESGQHYTRASFICGEWITAINADMSNRYLYDMATAYNILWAIDTELDKRGIEIPTTPLYDTERGFFLIFIWRCHSELLTS